jgi:hypothetical protein
MPSAEKFAANRSNAQRSTGPKTEAGKKAASRNATRHGLTGKHVVFKERIPKHTKRYAGTYSRRTSPQTR